jgi:hypothetical protein
MSARTADDLAHDLASLKIIDTDTHLSEPYDLWTSRAPAAYRDRVPQVKEVDGKRTWVVDRDVLLSYSGASSVVRRDGRKAAGVEFMRWQLEDVHAASYDV